MIFKRREKLPFWNRLREMMYPRKGFWRGMHYIRKRLHRLPDSPHRIALGFACGAAASFTPLFGLHILLAVGVAYLVRGNMLAAAFGTVVGNPVTFPFIAAASLNTGWLFLGAAEGAQHTDFSVAWMVDNIEEIFVPYLVGGILPGVLCGAVSYWIIGPIVEAYQDRRRKRLAMKAQAIREAAYEEQDDYRNDSESERGNV
jgi:uncharacterized protein (DUF2062 family)